ncbi:MAG: hypothetical protein ACLP4V_24910, partial [Methylocella sp.]
SAGGIIGKNPLKIGKRCWKAAGVHSGKLSPIHRIGNKPDRQALKLGPQPHLDSIVSPRHLRMHIHRKKPCNLEEAGASAIQAETANHPINS